MVPVMKSLDIRVAFSAIDRFTRPVNAARQSAGGLSDSLRKTQSLRIQKTALIFPIKLKELITKKVVGTM